MGSSTHQTKVTFSIEIRPATPEQKAAGKRLFSRLIARAQSDQKQEVTAKARAAGGGGAPPAVTENKNNQL